MGHETREECVKAADFLGTEPLEEYTSGTTHNVRLRCPTCDREYENVYIHDGLYDPTESEFVWRS